MWFDARTNGEYIESVAGGVSVDNFLEFHCYDAGGQKQGRALLHVSKVGRIRASGVSLQGRVVAASDEHYAWYALNPGKKGGAPKGLAFHLCSTHCRRCKVPEKGSALEHIDCWRSLEKGKAHEIAKKWGCEICEDSEDWSESSDLPMKVVVKRPEVKARRTLAVEDVDDESDASEASTQSLKPSKKSTKKSKGSATPVARSKAKNPGLGMKSSSGKKTKFDDVILESLESEGDESETPVLAPPPLKKKKLKKKSKPSNPDLDVVASETPTKPSFEVKLMQRARSHQKDLSVNPVKNKTTNRLKALGRILNVEEPEEASDAEDAGDLINPNPTGAATRKQRTHYWRQHQRRPGFLSERALKEFREFLCGIEASEDSELVGQACVSRFLLQGVVLNQHVKVMR